MPKRSDDWNGLKAWERKVLGEWDIDRLLTDLEVITQKRYRQNTRKDLLIGLLCGYTLKHIGKELCKNNPVIRTVLSGIYRDIEILTGEALKSIKASNLIYILEKYGYRLGSTMMSDYNRNIPHNLPAPTYTEFIGREAEMKLLLQRL